MKTASQIKVEVLNIIEKRKNKIQEELDIFKNHPLADKEEDKINTGILAELIMLRRQVAAL